jgi:tetratricopeptide (TPR) repeat protein
LYRFAETLFEKQIKRSRGIVKQVESLMRKNQRRRPPPGRIFDRNNIVNTLRKKNRLPVELWFWANRFFKRGRLEESREWFRKVLVLDSTPDHLRYEACVSLGDIARKLGRRGAEKWYRRALELCFNEPTLPDWKIYRAGSAYRKMGKDDLALPYFRKLAETAGLARYLVAGTFFHLGEILRKQGDARGARRCFRKCLAREPAHRKAKEYLERENRDKTKAA